MKLNCLFFPCLAQDSLSYLVFFFFCLDLAACFPSAQCLSTQRISQYPLHSPRDPLSATFIALSLAPQGTDAGGHFPPGDPAKAHFHFFCRLKPQANWWPIKDACSMVSIHFQVSECLTLKLFLTATRPWLLNLPLFLDCLTPTCPSGLNLDETSSRKMSLIYVPATGSGTASVLPWHPAPSRTCNFFFLIGSTSHSTVSLMRARVRSSWLIILLPVSGTVIGI